MAHPPGAAKPRARGYRRAIGRGLARALDSRDRGIELHAVALIGILAVFLGLEIYTVAALKHPFDPVAFGAGVTAIFTAYGLAAVGQGGQRRLEGDTPPPAAAPPNQEIQ